jgi:hypothetical protein
VLAARLVPVDADRPASAGRLSARGQSFGNSCGDASVDAARDAAVCGGIVDHAGVRPKRGAASAPTPRAATTSAGAKISGCDDSGRHGDQRHRAEHARV